MAKEEMEQARMQALLAEWTDGMSRANLPDWNSLPQLELYMDQVIILLTEYLSPLCRGGEEKAITASIINNYVRMHVMPPPRKKKYGRVHLACLVIICVLKQSLSISCIQRMLPRDQDEEAVHQLYDDFVREYRAASHAFVQNVQSPESSLLPQGGGSLTTSTAVFATLAKALTEYLLQEEEQEDDED